MLNNAYYKSYQLQLEGDVHKKLDQLRRGTVKSSDALEEKIKQVFSVVKELKNDVTILCRSPDRVTFKKTSCFSHRKWLLAN